MTTFHGSGADDRSESMTSKPEVLDSTSRFSGAVPNSTIPEVRSVHYCPLQRYLQGSDSFVLDPPSNSCIRFRVAGSNHTFLVCLIPLGRAFSVGCFEPGIGHPNPIGSFQERRSYRPA